jgi:ADP-ribosylglycohydrolase
MARDVLDAVYGCLIGGAIGDALGAPVETLYYGEIREKYGKLTEFVPSYRGNTGDRYLASRGEPGVPGAVTDDSTLRHYLSLAIAQKGGRVTPDDVGRIWLEKLNPNRFWRNERLVLEKLRIGMSPWDTGKGTPPTGCAVMGIAPVGIINAGNPAQAYQDGFNIAFVNQDDVHRDAAATVAAGIAAALVPDATVDDVLDAMLRHSSFVVKRAITLSLDLASASDSVDGYAERFYATMLDWTWPQAPDKGEWDKNHFFSGTSIELVQAVAAILYLCKGDVNDCIVEGASFGRDCDSIGSVAGSLAGALRGATAVRPDWIEAVERANEEFFEEVEGDRAANFRSMAQRLVAALRRERQATEERVTMLGRILGQEDGLSASA